MNRKRGIAFRALEARVVRRIHDELQAQRFVERRGLRDFDRGDCDLVEIHMPNVGDERRDAA